MPIIKWTIPIDIRSNFIKVFSSTNAIYDKFPKKEFKFTDEI